MKKTDVHLPYFPVSGETPLQRWKRMDYTKILGHEEQVSALSNERICPAKTTSEIGFVLFLLGIPAGIAVEFLLADVLGVVNYGIIIPAEVIVVVLFKYILPKLLAVMIPWVSAEKDPKSEKTWIALHEKVMRTAVLIADLMMLHIQ